jgi:hypothetical protein
MVCFCSWTFIVCGPAFATLPDSSTPAAQESSSPGALISQLESLGYKLVPCSTPPPNPWTTFLNGLSSFKDWKFLVKMLGDLMLAVILASAIAYHPAYRHKSTNLERIKQRQTLLMYAVAGVIVADLVVAVPPMAFVVFGIGGLLRFRTDVGSATNTGRVILVTLTGLACGLDMFAVAVFGTGFTWLLIRRLESKIFFTLTINWEDADLRKAAEVYEQRLKDLGLRVVGENKNFTKQQASFEFIADRNYTSDELNKKFEEIPPKLQGSLTWERI